MKFKSDASAQVILDAKAHLLSLQSKVYTSAHGHPLKDTEGESEGGEEGERDGERARERGSVCVRERERERERERGIESARVSE
jgi:hypothetical protein